MKWQRDKGPSEPLRLIRAAVMPLTFSQRVVRSVSESNLTVNSLSTHIVDLQPLAPGQKAEDVAPWAPGTTNQGSTFLSQAEAAQRGMQRAQFDAPNWVGMLVASHATAYMRHIDIPVWVDAQGTIQRVDVPALLAELEPQRAAASRTWGQHEGVLADVHQLVQAPKRFFGLLRAVPGEIKDLVKDIKGIGSGEIRLPEPVPAYLRPDLSQYPPVDGLDYAAVVRIQADPSGLAAMPEDERERTKAALRVWNERIQADPKLSMLFSTDVERVRQGAPPSWEE
jgi:hypothetical protein